MPERPESVPITIIWGAAPKSEAKSTIKTALLDAIEKIIPSTIVLGIISRKKLEYGILKLSSLITREGGVGGGSNFVNGKV